MINKAILIGNLGKDPEVKYTQGGTAIANFSVATTEKWKDKSSGEWKEKTEWHRCDAWGRLGEICGEYLTKGSRVYIEGRIQTDEWQDKDGNKRYTTKIVANEMKMLDRKGEQAPEQDIYGGKDKGPAPTDQQEERDDDIPF